MREWRNRLHTNDEMTRTESTVSDRQEIEQAILLLAEHGFEITNKRGGYFTKDDRFGYFHQTCYRSTYTPDDKMEALDSFLIESHEHLGE